MVNFLQYFNQKMFVLLLLLSFHVSVSFAQSSSIDLAIAINGSGSISSTDFSIQKRGIIEALNNPRVFTRDGSIGFTLIQYANSTTRVHVPYTVVNNESTIQNIIAQVSAVQQISGGTNPGDGILAAMSSLNAGGSSKNKKVICLSTDGIPNAGVDVGTAISSAKSAGLDRFGVIAIEDPPNAYKSDFEAVYNPLIFGGGSVTVVTSFLEYANILGTSCLVGDVELIGLEATQVIQDWQNSIPLIETKRTFVRAHIQSKDNMAVPLQARLTGLRNGVELLGSPRTATNASSFVAPAKAKNDQEIITRRNDIDNSLYFELPDDWTTGTIELRLEGGGTAIECKEVAGNSPNDCGVTVTFNSSKVMDIKFYAMEWTDAKGVDHDLPLSTTGSLFQQVENRTLSLFPIKKIDRAKAEHKKIYGQITAVPGRPYINVYSEVIKKLKTLHSLDQSKRLYFGFVDGPGPLNPLGLAASIPGIAGSGHINSKYTTVPHELSHLLGRQHVPFCGAITNSPQGFPSENVYNNKGAIGPMNKGINSLVYGYNSINNSAISPYQNFELMAYCPPEPRWPSNFTYKALNAAINSTFPNNVPPPVDGVLIASTSHNQPSNITQSSALYRVFRGTIDFDKNSVVFDPTVLLQSDTEPPLPSSGEYQLQVLDEQDKILKTIDFKPDVLQTDDETDSVDTEPTQGYFLIPISLELPIKKAIVLKDKVIIGQIAATQATPTVKVLFPNGGESLNDSTATFKWEASDPDGDALTYVVQFSSDNGSTWQTLDVDVPEKMYEAELSELGKTNKGLIRIIATDGFNVTMDVSDNTFITPNSVPEVFISSPTENNIFIGVQPIFFRGNAIDVEDGNLSGTNLSWSSNIDGVIGNGETFNIPASNLTEGNHTITLTAIDEAGASVSSSVNITILRFPPPPCAITNIISSGPAICEVTDNTYSQEIIVSYANAPGSGQLVVNGQSFPITTSPQKVTLTGLPADGIAVDIEAFFSNDSTCVFMKEDLFTTPESCTKTLAVKQFELINTISNSSIGILNNGDTINLGFVGDIPLNIRAITEPEKIGSVELILSGPISQKQTENIVPYTLFGDLPPHGGSPPFKYRGMKLIPGEYTLKAIPHEKADLKGRVGDTLSIKFWVEEDFVVERFTLINADTDQSIQELKDGDVIDLTKLASQNLNILAQTNPAQVGSVKFDLNGTIVIESTAPYAYAKNSGSNYYAFTLPVGDHVLTATPYDSARAGGKKGQVFTIHFKVIGTAVNSFVLLNADTEQDIQTLNNGDIIDLAKLPTQNLNIRAITNPDRLGSVVFELNDKIVIREDYFPYAIGGDVKGNFRIWSLPTGNHTLTVTPYQLRRANGKKGVSQNIAFKVINSAPNTRLEVKAAFAKKPENEVEKIEMPFIKAVPNPFSKQTIINFAVPTPGEAILNVYSTQGAFVDNLMKAYVEAEKVYSIPFAGNKLANGVYIIRLIANQNVKHYKVILAK